MRANHLISHSVQKPFPWQSLCTVAGDTNLFLGVTKSRPREGALWFSQCAHVDTTAWPLGTFNSQPAGVQLAPRPEAAIIMSSAGR